MSTHYDDHQDDRPPRHPIAVTVAAAPTHAVRMVVGSPASPVVAISGASGKGIPKAGAPLPVGWRGACVGMGKCRIVLVSFSLRVGFIMT